MTNSPAGLLPVFVYAGAVVLSVPVALVAYALSTRSRTFRGALGWVAAGVTGLVLAGATALAAFVDPTVGLVFAALVAAAGVVLAAFPLYIGRLLVERWTPLGPDAALEYATLGWPVAMVAGFVVFLAPGGPARDNLTFLSGPVAAIAWTVMGLVVTLGPGVAGYGLYRLVDRLG